MSDASLVKALKQIADVRRAADARAIAAEALAVHERERKARELERRLAELPSAKPLVSHRKLGTKETAADIQRRLYDESRRSA